MMRYGRGYEYGNSMMGGSDVFSVLLVFLFAAVLLALIALIIIWATQSSRSHGSPGTTTIPVARPGHDEAVAIAKRRVARGEITCDEYEAIMKVLGS